MITPIVTSLSREVIATVPAMDKEGAYALGATRWEMIRGAVWPHSQGGVVGAVLVGLGRAMGETIAAALVIGVVARRSRRTCSPPATRSPRSSPTSSARHGGHPARRADRARPGAVRAHDHRQPGRPRDRGAFRAANEGGLMAVASSAAAGRSTCASRAAGGAPRTRSRRSLMWLAFVIVLCPARSSCSSR